MIDLGDTLVRNNSVLPHVPEALKALSSFVTTDDDPLQMCLVSDFLDATPPTETQIQKVFQQYLQLLDGFGLKDFFEPTDKRITLSTHAGVRKPDRRVFELALERLGLPVDLSTCMFITENAGHIQACRAMGMETLQFGASVADVGVEFDNWSHASQLVADRLESHSDTNTSPQLAAQIGAHLKLDNVEIVGNPNGDCLKISGTVWQEISAPDLNDLDGVNVGLPVNLRCQVKEDGSIETLERNDPTQDDVNSAVTFAKSLLESSAISLDGHDTPGTSHFVERDAEGRRFLKRKGFDKT